jgi:hypothetical protein
MKINEDEVTVLRLQGCSWTKIALHFNVCISTLNKWRKRINYIDLASKQIVNVNEVTAIISNYLKSNTNCGERLLMGYLNQVHKVFIKRSELRNIVRRVDPDGVNRRKVKPILRKIYDGKAPGHVHHLDSHHKLSKFGFITFGVIDGFSHEIITLVCCRNNKAHTMLNAYVQSEVFKKRGVPELLRGDNGKENMALARFINALRGENHFIGGRSIHNQRIERLWRDVHRMVTKFYLNLFQNWELLLGLDINSMYDIWILQELFITRINEDLKDFQNAWNGHIMKGKLSPIAINLLNRNRYLSLEDNEFKSKVQTLYENLNEEYEPDNRPVSKSKCPFIDDIELDQFNTKFETIGRNDDVTTMEQKLLNAVNVTNTIIQSRV